MDLRLLAFCTIIVLGSGVALGQQRLTGDIYDQVRKGIDRMTEDEFLKLVPGSVTVRSDDQLGNLDYVLAWEEVCRIQVEFLDGKVASTMGTFSDAVASKTLTLANLKRISKGMQRQELEKLLAGGGSFREVHPKDSLGMDVQVCKWEQGRVMRVSIKDGKVSGGAYTSTVK